MAIKIELYTDFSCPWCLIGLTRLDRVIAEHFPEELFEIEHHPMFLMPDLPRDGIRFDKLTRERFGMSDPAQAWSKAEAAARSSRIEFHHRNQPFAVPTDRAYTLVRLARPLATQHALAVELTNAYLLRGLNIADVEVLLDTRVQFGFEKVGLAHELQSGVEIELTRAEVKKSVANGVRTIPHYVFDETSQLTGDVGEDVLATHIRAVIEKSDRRLSGS